MRVFVIRWTLVLFRSLAKSKLDASTPTAHMLAGGRKQSRHCRRVCSASPSFDMVSFTLAMAAVCWTRSRSRLCRHLFSSLFLFHVAEKRRSSCICLWIRRGVARHPQALGLAELLRAIQVRPGQGLGARGRTWTLSPSSRRFCRSSAGRRKPPRMEPGPTAIIQVVARCGQLRVRRGQGLMKQHMMAHRLCAAVHCLSRS